MYKRLHESIGYSPPISTTLEFTDRFWKKKTQISNDMRILPVGAEMFSADRWKLKN